MQQARLASILTGGGIAVIPTDTLYGVVAVARDRRAVARLFRLRRGRAAQKPFIILIPSVASLAEFGIKPVPHERAFLKRVWPGPVSVIFRVLSKKFSYLHRGRKSLAFRLPRTARLRALVAKTGPLVAPSANSEGAPPAQTLREARRYFGDAVDIYVGAGRRLRGAPSTLVSLEGGAVHILREGAGLSTVLVYAL